MKIYLSSGSWGKLPDKASPGVSARHSLLQQGFQNLPVRRSRFPLQNTSRAPFLGCLSQSTLGWWLVVSFISPAQGGAADRSLGAPARRVLAGGSHARLSGLPRPALPLQPALPFMLVVPEVSPVCAHAGPSTWVPPTIFLAS